jgi:hypothetical protein
MHLNRWVAVFGTAVASVAAALFATAMARPAYGQVIIKTQAVSPAQRSGTTKSEETVQGTPKPVPVGGLPEDVFATENAAAKTATSAITTEAQKKALRLQKIQQLTFDRRPSSILKAWSTTPEEEAAQEKEALEKAKAARPVPARVVATAPDTVQTAENAEPDSFDAELKAFRRSVTLGDWNEVKQALKKLPEDEGKALFKQLLQGLPSSPFRNNMANVEMQQGMMQQPVQFQFQEKNVLSNADVIGIALADPVPLDDPALLGLGQLLRLAQSQGHVVEDLLARFKTMTGDTKTAVLSSRQAAKLLMACDHAVEAKVFLPEPEKAEADNDREALNMLSRHYLAVYAKEKKPAQLEQAWKVTQAVLAVGKVDREQKEEALKRAVELAPKIRAELGKTWLEDSFTKRPERGREILTAIGVSASQGMQQHARDPDFRYKTLELEKIAVEALLKASPEKSKEWRNTLAVLAGAWLAEAAHTQQYDTSTSLGAQMRRDMYGNFFYYNMNNNEDYQRQNMMNQPQFPQPLTVQRILDVKPGDTWLQYLDDSRKPKFASQLSQLYLKVGEDELAFPFIERLAPTDPEQARELSEEFLRVWTKNHDPNAERNLRNPYMYMFGFERKAESIPLTRSKQERNLKELAGWVTRLRKLPIGKIDEKLIARAFTACHSSAEVYRLESIESVFGSFDALKPETLAEMAQQMRGNLAGLWRSVNNQEQNKTKRKEKDIRAEVLRGYQVARSVVERGLQKHGQKWPLVLAHAALLHDEIHYLQEIELSADFSKRRKSAFEEFALAARLYVAQAGQIPEEEETLSPFDQWFYAALGACDIAAINEKTLADFRQTPLIRDALNSLPGESADRHMNKFANAMFMRMSSVNPAVKFRYLKGGFEIVGDNKQAAEARKVYNYYKDLVTEIKLDAAVDGSADVGSGEPFGLFVNLRHTREIEREAAGFGKYLQNQNQGNMFYYNYGRPLENYRDKFQDSAKKALEEHFEVLSITFQDEKVNSRSTADYGWRYTPYAYILMKARSPKVDKIPPLRLDLDFLDTSGYVILPVESPIVPIDANAKAVPRPYNKLQLTETLDERQAKDGKLILEIKAVAQGLVPKLDEILKVESAGFEVVKTDDQALSVSKFDPDSEANLVVTERGWLVTLKAIDGLPKRPESFHFPEPKVETAETIYQRYVDADLAKVDPVIRLEEQYGKTSQAWIYWTIGGVILTIGLAVLLWSLRPRTVRTKVEKFQMPDPVTPFAVIGLLREIHRNNGLSAIKEQEIAMSIQKLETHYFAQPTTDEPNLHEIASNWIRLTS